jgi:hypothetical protein
VVRRYSEPSFGPLCLRFFPDDIAAKRYLGDMTIEKIMERLPKNIRLLHAELVLRFELQDQFDQLRDVLKSKYIYSDASRKW